MESIQCVHKYLYLILVAFPYQALHPLVQVGDLIWFPQLPYKVIFCHTLHIFHRHNFMLIYLGHLLRL